jgi:hypothetical protein
MNPQKQKPAISVCGPRQLIVNSQKAAVTTLCTLWGDRKQQTELSKREKWLVPVSTRVYRVVTAAFWRTLPS